MDIILHNISKSYQELPVLQQLSLHLTSGRPYCLMAPSGCGKTTLMRILLGLEKPDSGTISCTDGMKLTAVFQEDRLAEMFTPVEQLLMVSPRGTSVAVLREELSRLLPEESLSRPCTTLSGGMKRRVAICRAMAAGFDACLMDEPFTGLDEDTKALVISYIKEKSAGKLLLISTHQEDDIEALDGTLISLNKINHN